MMGHSQRLRRRPELGAAGAWPVEFRTPEPDGSERHTEALLVVAVDAVAWAAHTPAQKGASDEPPQDALSPSVGLAAGLAFDDGARGALSPTGSSSGRELRPSSSGVQQGPMSGSGGALSGSRPPSRGGAEAAAGSRPVSRGGGRPETPGGGRPGPRVSMGSEAFTLARGPGWQPWRRQPAWQFGAWPHTLNRPRYFALRVVFSCVFHGTSADCALIPPCLPAADLAGRESCGFYEEEVSALTALCSTVREQPSSLAAENCAHHNRTPNPLLSRAPPPTTVAAVPKPPGGLLPRLDGPRGRPPRPPRRGAPARSAVDPGCVQRQRR